VGWTKGAWQAQVSAGHLHVPEWFEPYDETRLTASIGFDGAMGSRPFSALLAWGENRQEIVKNGVSDSFLLEWDLRATAMTSFYGRAEVAGKEILGLGFHPFGFAHPHLYSGIDDVSRRPLGHTRRTRPRRLRCRAGTRARDFGRPPGASDPHRASHRPHRGR